MPPWDNTGFIHFHSSTISGSAAWMSLRTLASIFPRQSPRSWILASINAEADADADADADAAGTGFFMTSLQLSQPSTAAAGSPDRDPISRPGALSPAGGEEPDASPASSRDN